MINLNKSGIVCLVSMFYLKQDSLEKPDVIETTYSNQLVQTSQQKESSMLQYICSLTKPNVIENMQYLFKTISTNLHFNREESMSGAFLYGFMLRIGE